MFRERNDIPPLRIVICKERNPKAHKLGLLIHKRKNTKVIGRESRGIRSGYESSESEPKKRTEPQTETVRKSDTKEAGRWKSEGERNSESEKKKVAALREETVTAERFSGKEGRKSIGERTRRTTKARVGTKSSSSTEGGEPRNLSVHRTKITVSASKTISERTRRTTKAKRGRKNHSSIERSEPRNLSVHRTKVTVSASKTIDERTRRTTKAREVKKSRNSTEGSEPRNLSVHKTKVNVSTITNREREAERLNTVRGEAKQLTSKTSGIHKPNLNRYKSISFNSKGAYYESSNCVTELVKWEYIQMSMCDWKLIRRCMIDGNLKLCVWNCYSRKFVMINMNNVCMMYDETNINTLTIPTTKGKHHTSELRSCIMLKHACEFMSNQKICNSITRTENNVLHDLGVIKEIHTVCKDCYVFKLKNQTISTHLYSKAKIQPSPQIKL